MSNLANSTQIVGGNPLAEMKGTIGALVGVAGILFGAYYAYDSPAKIIAVDSAYQSQQQDQVIGQKLDQNQDQVMLQQLDQNQDQVKREKLDQNQDQVKREKLDQNQDQGKGQQLDQNQDQVKRQQLDQNQDQVKRQKQQTEKQQQDDPRDGGKDIRKNDKDKNVDDSDSSISEDDSSSDDDTTEESSDDQCQAVRADGQQCTRAATENGACSHKAHQRQMRANMQRQIQMDLDLDLDLSEIADIIGRNPKHIIENIKKLLKGARNENHGFIYIYNLPNGLIKIGRTGQDNPRDRWNQQRQYAIKNGPKVWTCRVHNLAEVLVLNILDFARQGRLEEFDEGLISREDMERVIRAVIKAINKFMKRQDSKNDGEEETSDPHSIHFSDQNK